MHLPYVSRMRYVSVQFRCYSWKFSYFEYRFPTHPTFLLPLIANRKSESCFAKQSDRFGTCGSVHPIGFVIAMRWLLDTIWTPVVSSSCYRCHWMGYALYFPLFFSTLQIRILKPRSKESFPAYFTNDSNPRTLYSLDTMATNPPFSKSPVSEQTSFINLFNLKPNATILSFQQVIIVVFVSSKKMTQLPGGSFILTAANPCSVILHRLKCSMY